jgi:peptidoglycan/LPS O-acetylase OafA/YrhL
MEDNATSAAPATFSPGFVSFLDLSRWLAAMVVFLGHLRNPLFIGYGDLAASDRNLVVQGWYFVTGWATEAVLVFFVLSGFLVGGRGIQRLIEGRFDGYGYAADRFARISIGFFPALLLGAALDLAGQHWFGWAGLWNHGSALMRTNFPDAPFTETLTWSNALANMAMLQSFKTAPLGSNMPLWSLSYEFWFYTLFGCLMVAVGRPGRARWAAIALALAVGLVIGPKLIFLVGVWSLGAAAFVFRARFLRWPWLSLIVFVGVLTASRLLRGAPGVGDWTVVGMDQAVGVAFAWVLLSWREQPLQLLKRLGGLNRYMADFSYSLYLIHFPLMLFVLAGLATAFGLTQLPTGFSPTDPVGLGLYAATVAIVVPAAMGFALLTEKHTPALRSLLRRRARRP